MSHIGKTFRIFVSSTLNDLKEERNALQKNVFPRLRELSMQHGCRFQSIDLRWGVREESALDQQTMKICYEEIARCQRVTPRPNFIVLLGDRYGWRPLPFEIPADEFVEIEQRVSDTDKELLKKWYRRDDNAVPPVYCLQPRTGEFTDYTKWEFVERRLHSILLQAAAEMKLTADSHAKYFASATEQEIIRGLKAQDNAEHVFGFFKSIRYLPQNPCAKEFIDLDEMGNLDRDANKYLNDLKDRLRRLLPGNIFEYEAEWTGSETTSEHIDRLCRDVYDSLSTIIQKEIAELEESDPLNKEIADHIASGKERAKFFIGRTSILKTISEYVKGTDPHPLAVSGASGSGKSALMAHAVEKVPNEHKNAEVVVRFIGATPDSSDVRTLLESLCRQISRCYRADESTVPADFRDLIKELPKRLALATAAKPLILFLDALDQLSSAYNARNLIWLPSELPGYVRLVVSTLPGECFSALKKKVPGANFTELEPMPPDEGAKLLDMWLDDAHRKLQEDQRAEILRKFELCGMPLYLRLAFGEAQRWKSYDGLPLGSKGHGLSEDISGIIRNLFWRLSQESNHGRKLVERSLGYLAASRNGLTEDEMLDVLSQDDELYQDFLERTYHKPPEQRLPVVIWSRLYFDLEPYLTERSADGTTLLAFYHRQLGEVVIEEYLAKNAKQNHHRGLAKYFTSQHLWIERGGKKIFHLRKLSEQPYQQTCAEMWKELEVTLTDLEFIEAKCIVGMTLNLVEDYGTALSLEGMYEGKRSNVESFSRFLRARSHVLLQRPDLLVQEAFNFAAFGSLHRKAEEIVSVRRCSQGPWLRRINLPTEVNDICIQTLVGHAAIVKAVSMTQDGQRVVTGSDDGTVKVWDLLTGACLMTMEGHGADINSVVVTPDGRRAVTGSDDETVKVWDLGTGTCLRTLQGHRGQVRCVALSRDSHDIVSGGVINVIGAQHISLHGEIRVWDLEDGECKQVLEEPSGRVNAVALTHDGRVAVTGMRGGVMSVWDIKSGTRLGTIEGHYLEVFAVAISPDGRWVVTGGGGNDTNAVVWDFTTGQMRLLQGHTDDVKALSFMPDGHRVLSGSEDMTIKVWDITTGECQHTLKGHVAGVRAVAAASDGRHLYSASSDWTVKVWDVSDKSDVQVLSHHVSEVHTALTTTDGRLAITGSDGLIKIWNMLTGECIRTFQGHTHDLNAIAVTPDNHRIVVSWGDNELKVLDLITGECQWTLIGHVSRVTSVAVTPDGRRVVSGSLDKTVKVWDLASGKCLRTLQGHDYVYGAALTPDGRFVVSGSKDLRVTPDGRFVVSGIFIETISKYLRVCIWDIESGTCLHILSGLGGSTVQSVKVSPDSRWLISMNFYSLVRECRKVWDMVIGVFLHKLFTISRQKHFLIDMVIHMVMGVYLHKFERHKDIVRAFALTPDGHLMVTTSWDKTLMVRDTESGECLKTIKGHKRAVESVGITTDGHYVVSGSVDQTLRLWDLQRRNEVACFFADGQITANAITPDGRRMVAADNIGRVYILCLENIVPGPPVVTAWRMLKVSPIGAPWARFWIWKKLISAESKNLQEPAFGCPLCRTWSEIPASALGTEIPCPHCGKPVRLNPFTINADWRPIAKAWRRKKDGSQEPKSA